MDEVYVFDWSGKPVKNIALPGNVYKICVDDDGVLYMIAIADNG